MAVLHGRGVELVCELLSAADHLEKIKPEDVRELLRESATVLGDLLKRDKPAPPPK
ncbi:hypothetical protein MesoLj113c_71770 [Mesorhizobium sp. 113-3-9]|uniref:hypothetical protein n=1 Tax=Mesorhizobium sp. 113-3-9 TaxID=2744517 RepID=UPI00192644DD|nr:hypothetical protein [Mesorhizobium sp. 113-3-9]BCG91067.1 hypothetical protein MesoLj113c_71770 [Mesorhizobium sp. 113-3-9]